MDRVGSAHSIDTLLGELDDDDGLAELEQELGLNDDAGGSGEYPMTVLHSHSAGGGGFAPPTRGSGGFSSFLSSSPTTASSTSSSLSFGRGDGSGVGVGDAERGELAIVQHYKSKFSNDALKAQDAADNTVKAVFIIKFDVNEGNVIAWQYPKDIDLSGIEFKAMASGSHNVDSDIVYVHSVASSIQTLHRLMRDSRYFKVGDLYGVSCYEKRLMRGNVELRGVLMSAVGLLSTNYHNHHHHISFLSDQVHGVNHVPGFDYELLEEYFHNSHQVLDSQTSTSSSSSSSSSPPSPLPSSPLVSRIPHGYFISFLRHFGPHVFSIWKSVLLRQRILFYAPPPVRATCAHVYCANMLAYTRVRQFRWDANPLFYVNINDMKVLHEQETFIAATTEAIFQKKFNIYDVYVAKYKFHMPTKEAELPLRVTDGDRSRYRYLLEIVSTYLDTYKAEQHLIKFFLGLNNRLFEGLLRAHQEGEVVQASDLTERFGLHPSDLTFFSALAGTLNLNFPVAPPKSCLCC